MKSIMSSLISLVLILSFAPKSLALVKIPKGTWKIQGYLDFTEVIPILFINHQSNSEMRMRLIKLTPEIKKKYSGRQVELLLEFKEEFSSGVADVKVIEFIQWIDPFETAKIYSEAKDFKP